MKKILLVFGITIALAVVGIFGFFLVYHNTAILPTLKKTIGMRLDEIDKVGLESRISGHKLRIHNKKEFVSLVQNLGTFQPLNGLEPKEGYSFTVERLRVILVSQPVYNRDIDLLKQQVVFDTEGNLVSNATYEIARSDGLLDFYIYIDPEWIRYQRPVILPGLTDPKLAQEYLLNWQFVQLAVATNNKNTLQSPLTVYDDMQKKITEWEQAGASGYLLSL